MAQPKPNKNIIDYSKWDDITMDDINTVHSQIPFTNTGPMNEQDAQRIKIPRSPRPLPAEPPVLASDGLLEPPPMNAPKGAAAVRHYQVGFRHKIINKKKNRRAASMSVFDDMHQFLSTQQQESKKKYGITVEDDNTELFKECGELLEFMAQQPQSHVTDPTTNSYEYYRRKAMKTHGIETADETRDLPKVDVVVKMGGAFITNKKKMHCLKQEHIDAAARDICDAFTANYVMILIHGAGSYGHFEAKKYKLMKGLYCDESRQGMVVCRAAVSILHQHVLAKLLEYRVPVISVSPNTIVTSSDGVVSRRQFKPFVAHIKKILKNGMVPLIHGDVIFDDKRGCHILSGDTILEHLCSIFSPQRAVFWSSMNGVYDCRHINKKYELIKRINVNPQGMAQLDADVVRQLKNPQRFLNEQQNEQQDEKEIKREDMVNIDVTGGMWGKIQVAARCCAQGIDVVITKGATEDAKLALLGKEVHNASVFVPDGSLI